MASNVPLHEVSNTLTCAYGSAKSHCGAAAAWHLSWFDAALRSFDWENSLACQKHRELAEERGWLIGWRHRVSPACCMPGALLRISDEGTDEDGLPISFCYHPWDVDSLVAEVEEPAVSAGALGSYGRRGIFDPGLRTYQSMNARSTADRSGFTVNRNGQMAVQFRLTDEQALALAGRLMRATGKTLIFDPSEAVSGV